jgi:hypothetical protein
MGGFWSVSLEETPAWTWHESAGDAPFDRYLYGQAYDPSRDRILVQGGYDDTDHYFDDWWVLSFDRPTPVLASLVSARLENGMARLEWHLSGGTAGPLAVERARQGGAWETAAGAVPDGDGVVRFEDAGVAPGARIGYRLRVTETSGTRTLGETWLEAPDAAAFALRGAVGNPVAGDLDVAFALDRPGRVEIELMDLQGRRIATRSLAGGAGEHRLRLAARGAVAPGMYFIRLRQDERAAVARVAVVR